jgi:hypothetical protein
MKPNIKIVKHIDSEFICAYCGKKRVMYGESLCLDCIQKIKSEKLSWTNRRKNKTDDNRQLFLPGFINKTGT